MTDTPSSVPREPAGDTPEQGGGEQFAARPGQHESANPHPQGTGAVHGRHEMAGGAGYPQFEGPGAAQYGSEPVEPPPAVAPTPHPTYGPPGSGPGTPPPGAMAPLPGTVPSPQDTMPAPGVTAPEGMVPTPAGAMPPTDEQQTYGYQLAAPTGLDVGNALSYGLEKFRANPAPWLGITALGVVIYLAFVLVVQTFEPESLLSVLLIFLAVMAAIWLLQAAMVRGGLYETDGNKPVFGSYFRFVNAGNVLLTALLAFIGTWVGLAFCVIPGLIAGFLCIFALHFVVDQDQGPFEAIKSSAMLVVTNIGPVLLLTLAVAVITFLGALLCGLGLLVAGPISVIAVTYSYRRLTGGTIMP